jgi:CHAT domain-containing protein
MAFLNKHFLKAIIHSTIVWCGVGLFACKDPAPGKPAPPAQDTLASYLETLYELVDKQPDYYAAKTDSLLATVWRQPNGEKEKTSYLDFVLNSAYHLQQLGQIPASTRWYEQGLNFLQTAKLPSYDGIEFVLKPLGNNYVRLGDFDKAIGVQQMAIDAAQQNNPQLLAALQANLAITYWSFQQYDTALRIANKALDYTQFDQSSKGRVWNIKATILLEQGQLDSAAFCNQQALAFFRSTAGENATPIWVVATLETGGRILLQQNQPAAAFVKLNNARQLLQETYPDERPREQAKLMVSQAQAQLQLKSNQSAILLFQQAITQFIQAPQIYFPDNTVTAAYAGLAQAFQQKGSDSALHYHQLAVENDYYTQQLITTSASSSNFLVRETAMSQAAIEAMQQAYQKTNNPLWLQKQCWLMELTKARQLQTEMRRTKSWSTTDQQKINPLLQELRFEYLRLAESTDAGAQLAIRESIRTKELALGLQENRFAQALAQPSFQQFLASTNALQKNNALVSYYFTDQDLRIITAANNQWQSFVLSADSVQQSVTQMMGSYFNENGSTFVNNPQAYFAQSHRLLQQLLPTINNNQKRIIIAADGCLHQLPFEALSANASNQFLGASTTVSYVFSLMQYQQQVAPSAIDLPIQLIAFDEPHLGFAALPNAKRESKYIAAEFNAKELVATDLTMNELEKQLQEKAILHFATHAVADTNGAQPFLVLKEKCYLGQLQYTTTNAPLVVLTACETAKGQLQAGEGLSSIGRTFLSKGVKGVLAGRWKVDDAVAPKIIQEFYNALRQSNNPADALQKARQQYLSQASLAQQDPKLWAVFCYMGIDQNIRPQQKPISTYWILAAIAILLSLIVWFKKNYGKKKG